MQRRLIGVVVACQLDNCLASGTTLPTAHPSIRNCHVSFVFLPFAPAPLTVAPLLTWAAKEPPIKYRYPVNPAI